VRGGGGRLSAGGAAQPCVCATVARAQPHRLSPQSAERLEREE
jgi:hypothetical protein